MCDILSQNPTNRSTTKYLQLIGSKIFTSPHFNAAFTSRNLTLTDHLIFPLQIPLSDPPPPHLCLFHVTQDPSKPPPSSPQPVSRLTAGIPFCGDGPSKSNLQIP